MSFWKVIGIGLLALLGIMILAGVFFTYQLNRSLDAGCERIEAIARNPDYVAYMDQWASKNTIGRGYYLVWGMHGDIAAHLETETDDIHIIQVPAEEDTGIEKQYFRFSLEKIGGDHHTPITERNVKRIVFGRGRNSMIIMRNGHLFTEHRGHGLESRHLLKINENVFAYCSDARFRM